MQNAIADRAKSITADRAQGKKLTFVLILGRSCEQPPYELLRAETLASVKVIHLQVFPKTTTGEGTVAPYKPRIRRRYGS